MKSEEEIKKEIKEQVEEEYATAKQLVEEVLAEDERARNDYMWLNLMVWQKKQQISVFIDYKDIGKMISPSTIHRVCQVIQHDEGKYLPTDPMQLLRRKIREDIIRQYFGRQRSERNDWILEEWEKKKFKIK